MATVNKDFKIKNGLVVEGSNATVNGNQILTENASDQYIINLIGGSATSANTPDTVVLRDGSGDFAAGTITAETALSTDTINIGAVGVIESQDDDDLYITATNGHDVRMDAADDIRIRALGGDVVIGGNENGHIRFVDAPVHIGFPVTSENEVATKGYVDDAITNIDLTFNTDEITEGTTNLYYTDARVDSHLSGGDGINYSSGTISADVAGGLHISNEQIQINRNTVDGWYDASGAAATAQSNAEDYADGLASNYDPAGSASTAESNANSYTDGEITTALTTAQGYADTAEANANAYTDNAVSGLAWKTAVNLKVTDNINVAGNQVGAVFDGHAALTTADAGYRFLVTDQNTASENGIWESFVDGAALYFRRPTDADVYTELVGAAVYIMEGTQYGSTSWVQGNHYLTDFTGQSWTQFSGQGSVTAGDGITVDGLEVSVNRTEVDTWYDAAGSADTVQGNLEDHASATSTHGVTEIVGTSESQTLTNKTIDASSNTLSNIANSSLTNSSITVNGYSTSLGDSVTLDTDDVSEGTAKYFTDERALDATASAYDATGTAQGIVDALDSDDIEEGTINRYYTDGRAEEAAGNQLANATKSNIDITYVDGVLSITAENGVAGSDTDDLTEGSTNLYFTDERAVDAIGGSNIQPLSIDINTYRTEEATQQVVASASTVTAHTFSGNKSVKYLVRTVGNVSGTLHSQITELLVTVDGNNNVAVTEYGTIYTSENPLATATMDYDSGSGQYRLRVTTAITGAEVVAAATIMSWAD